MIAIPICNIIVMPAALVAFVLMPFGLEILGLKPMGWGIEGMTWCANTVGSLPGAVGHIREIPTIAFALMLTGGVWLALWQTRLRLLGAAVVLVGLIMAPGCRVPIFWSARRAHLSPCARRPASSRLCRPKARNTISIAGSNMTATTGALRKRSILRRFSCDAVGCIAHDKGAVIAIARHPAAITDDCGNADVLVLDMPKPADCAVPVTVIDVFDRWRNGAYALYLDQNDLSPQPHVRVETVAAHRGDRPWSRLPPPHVPRTPAGRAALPKPQILDALSQSPAGEQPAVATRNDFSGRHDPPELRPSSGDDDPGEEGQAAASDANDVSDAQ